MGGVKI